MQRLGLHFALPCIAAFAVGCSFLPTFTNGAEAQAPRPYVADTLTHDLGLGRVRTIGCLDVGIGISAGHRPSDEWLLDIDVGNRCGTNEALDLGKIALEAFERSGARIGMWLLDPRATMHAIKLPGSTSGHETIRLASSLPRERIAIVCANLSRVVPDPGEARQPICFERAPEAPEGWRIRSGS